MNIILSINNDIKVITNQKKKKLTAKINQLPNHIILNKIWIWPKTRNIEPKKKFVNLFKYKICTTLKKSVGTEVHNVPATPTYWERRDAAQNTPVTGQSRRGFNRHPTIPIYYQFFPLFFRGGKRLFFSPSPIIDGGGFSRYNPEINCKADVKIKPFEWHSMKWASACCVCE